MKPVNPKLRFSLPWLVAILLVSAVAAAPYANPQLLVETDELARLLGAPGIRIVDLRGDPDRGEAAYRAGHVLTRLTPGDFANQLLYV